ncbi:hypothetical protein ACSQ67_013453 [Phaseolus vulgaris]
MCSVHPAQTLPYRPDSEIIMRNIEEGKESSLLPPSTYFSFPPKSYISGIKNLTVHATVCEMEDCVIQIDQRLTKDDAHINLRHGHDREGPPELKSN